LEDAIAELGGPYARRGLLALLRSNLMGDGGYFAVVRALAAKVIVAQRLGLAVLGPSTRTVSPAFGVVATPPAGQACRTPAVRQQPAASAGTRSTPAAPATPATPAARGRRLRIAVSHVGADQEWADWAQGLLARDGHDVTQIRWNPARGERLAETAERIRREKADLVLVVLSRRYRAPHPERPGSAVLEQWELLADGGRLGERVIRMLVDHEPLPEPLRSSKTLDLSELGPGQVERLREAVGPGRPTAPVRAARRELRRPGEPPQVWNVPAENEFFTGRDDELALVRELLEKHGRVALAAEGGLPDMGETEVAIEYAHRYKLRYETVWWISCESRVRIRAELDELARRLGKAASSGLSGSAGAWFRGGGFGDPGGIGAKQAGIAPSSANGLLVCSGVADPAVLGEFLGGVQGHVLVVADSVGAEWDGGTVHIGRLRRAESVLLLRDAATMVDPSTAALVAEALDDRPALVAETARYLVRQEVSPEVCLRLLTMRSEHRPQSHANGVGERRPGADGSGADDARPHEESGAGDVATALGAGRAVAGRVRITERDVDSLLAELMRVDYINDPTNFRTWLATLETFLGRRPDIPDSAVLSSRLMAVVAEAAEQAGPGMLDAVARALEAVSPADRSVGRFRRLVETLSTRWSETPPAPSGDSQAVAAPAARTRAVVTGSAVTGSAVKGSAAMGSEAGEASFYFFTSYARRDDRRLVQQFHERFQAELERKVRRSVNCTGFLDRLSMEGGAHWRVELRRALQSSPIMLALWSDDYFDSRWCGREFAVFTERVRRVTKPGEPPPACILPLRWLRLQDEIPRSASGLQIMSMDLGKNYDEMPLVDLMRQHPRIFQKYLIKLVDRVMSVTKAPLPSLDEKTAEQIQPAFGRQP
jgi:hypothetical protein